MSDSESEEVPQVTEEEVAREVEDKCYKAFKEFDHIGSGGEVKVDQIRDVLEHMEIKMADQEMYSIISDIDPTNTGFVQYASFKAKVVQREIERRVEGDVSELLDAYVAMG